ncbi:methyltransferase domain-containing protein [Candidatus Parcubacteria bacterium]|nr:methyltransferase domain-containing protein [Candidatus Parcubacteria bacterium]
MDNIQARFNQVKKSKVFNRIVEEFDLRNKKVLDLGCGYGEYLARFGAGSLGITTNMAEVDYARGHGLNAQYGNVELIDAMNLGDNYNVIWANNLFEHILSPHAFLIKLKKISTEKTLLILGVPIIPKIVFLLRLNKFRGSLASNHINFFTNKSLKLTVERAGWRIKDTRPFVLKALLLDRLLNFIAPHIYIIAQNDLSFRYPEKKIKEWGNEEYYQNLLKINEQQKN